MSLALASVVVSIVASTTALALMNDMRLLPEPKRKAVISMAAIVLGGGIWSMHFLAILSLNFSVPVHYDLLQTLSSGLISVLVVGLALLLLHFRERTHGVLTVAGVALGTGIVSMHFVGMLGMRGVIPEFSLVAILAGTVVALITGVVAVRVSYTSRTRMNIVKGGVIFGLSVVLVHYVSMIGTEFSTDPAYNEQSIALDQSTLAIVVTIAAFCICGAFLLAASTFVPHRVADPTDVGIEDMAERANRDTDSVPTASFLSDPKTEAPVNDAVPPLRIPYEEHKQIVFVPSDEVGAVRADGRYTQLYTRNGVKFCPWSITEAEKRLGEHGFYRSHRSYLINVQAVAGFQKNRESGVCRFEGFTQLENVPVSRARVGDLVEELGL